MSVQAQILNLLEDMKVKSYGLNADFIAHDLAVVKMISDRIIVMYLGKTCEVGPVPTRCTSSPPLHPYTRALLDAHGPTARSGRRGSRLEAQPRG